jgi:hypothetical protein
MEVRIPKNHVLVEVEQLRHKKVSFESGTEIIVDPTFFPQKHAQTNGIIHAIPESLYFNQSDGMQSAEYVTNITAQVGDKVFFHYLQIDRAVAEKRIIEEDGKFFIFITHDSMFCSIRDNEVVMHNGWMLLEPIAIAIDGERPLSHLPRSRQKNDPLRGKIAFLGEKVTQYFYGSETDVGIDVETGDEVIFMPHSDIPFEYPIHETFNKPYFRVQRKEVLSHYIN